MTDANVPQASQRLRALLARARRPHRTSTYRGRRTKEQRGREGGALATTNLSRAVAERAVTCTPPWPVPLDLSASSPNKSVVLMDSTLYYATDGRSKQQSLSRLLVVRNTLWSHGSPVFTPFGRRTLQLHPLKGCHTSSAPNPCTGYCSDRPTRIHRTSVSWLAHALDSAYQKFQAARYDRTYGQLFALSW